MDLYNDLISFQDLKYKEFNCSLIPSRPKSYFIGVRIPILRKFSKEFIKDDRKDEFLNSIPHQYYEENMIHRYLIESIKDYNTFIIEINKLLPNLESWAETDGFRNKSIEKNLDIFLIQIKEWLKSSHPYTVRFSIDMLQSYYLKEKFDISHLKLVGEINDQDHYYIKMMQAWYYATAMIDHFDEVINYLLTSNINDWTYNKALQKAIESFRISDEQKIYLKSIKK